MGCPPSRKRDNLVRRSMSFHASEKSFDPSFSFSLCLPLWFIHGEPESSLVGCDTFRGADKSLPLIPVKTRVSSWNRRRARPRKAANVRSLSRILLLPLPPFFPPPPSPLFDQVCFVSVPRFVVYSKG